MKTFTTFDTYFEKLGISTRYNTLGYNSDMISAFVDETKHIVGRNPSNFHKSACYDKYYDMVGRPKYTGFEWAKEEDYNLRELLYKHVAADQTQEQFFLDGTKSSADYKTLLKESLTDLDDVLIYLSGGVDSELVARAAIEHGVKFTPVILQYIKDGKLMNEYDTVFAKEFCANNGLTPFLLEIDVLKVWQSVEFFDLAVAMGTVSPQQALYGYAVLEVEKAFPGILHMFGGEVRYLSQVEAEDNKLADLVMLAKITPGYNGQSYSTTSTGVTGPSYTALRLAYSSGGSWSIGGGVGGSVISNPITGSPQSGSWTTTPASAYEINTTTNSLSGSGSFYSVPANGSSSGYTSIGSTEVAYLNVNGGPTSASASFSMSCRATASPGTVVSSSISFSIS